jgi:hypothetical protein
MIGEATMGAAVPFERRVTGPICPVTSNLTWKQGIGGGLCRSIRGLLRNRAL